MKNWKLDKKDFMQASKVFSSTEGWQKITSDGKDIPQNIGQWISRLKLFYGIPFNYLVPEDRMLPLESIRFFYVDQNWVRALVGGALSIGRSTTSDLSHDEAVGDSVHQNVNRQLHQVREGLLGKELSAADILDGECAGFLLRSVLVSAWPGLEVEAFADKSDTDKQTPLTILRMERLADNVLLCIFKGVFERLQIHEPPEGLHFGADLSPDGKYTKIVRAVGGSKLPLGAQVMDKDAVVDVPMREKAPRVIQIEALVNNFKQMLTEKEVIGSNFTSAEFAVEMIESAKSGVFDKQN